MLIFRIIFAIIFPPIAVIDKGCGSIALVSVLTILGYFPGMVAALYITVKSGQSESYEDDEEFDDNDNELDYTPKKKRGSISLPALAVIVCGIVTLGAAISPNLRSRNAQTQLQPSRTDVVSSTQSLSVRPTATNIPTQRAIVNTVQPRTDVVSSTQTLYVQSTATNIPIQQIIVNTVQPTKPDKCLPDFTFNRVAIKATYIGDNFPLSDGIAYNVYYIDYEDYKARIAITDTDYEIDFFSIYPDDFKFMEDEFLDISYTYGYDQVEAGSLYVQFEYQGRYYVITMDKLDASDSYFRKLTKDTIEAIVLDIYNQCNN